MSEGAIYDVADRFGVDLDQARRDHVISHILASISRHAPARFISPRPPGPSVFQPPPTESAWRASLGHQTILEVTAAEAADVVTAAWDVLATP